MDEGNSICSQLVRKDVWALAAAAQINKVRGGSLPLRKTAHILTSLKRPEEVATLRKIYGDGLYVIGVFATEEERLENLINSNVTKEDALRLIKRDAEETDLFGQQTRSTFYLADVFVQLWNNGFEKEIERFLDLVFSHPYLTPTQAEHAMFMAYASSLRSGQLGRQVGAAITSKSGEILALGCNDVPRPGGGLYWPGEDDQRDHVRLKDSNDIQRQAMVEKILDRLQTPAEDRPKIGKAIRDALDVTEYRRAVHAEMDSLLSAARAGVSPAGAILYTTTFPCHNCTRHIIAAGISRVYYIEPYAKSRAEELHEDAIVVEEKSRQKGKITRKVPFTPFVGIGPRKYFDLFSLSLGSGCVLSRKSKGEVFSFDRQEAWPRVPMSPSTYIQRELVGIEQLEKLPAQPSLFGENENDSDQKQID